MDKKNAARKILFFMVLLTSLFLAWSMISNNQIMEDEITIEQKESVSAVQIHEENIVGQSTPDGDFLVTPSGERLASTTPEIYSGGTLSG